MFFCSTESLNPSLHIQYEAPSIKKKSQKSHQNSNFFHNFTKCKKPTSNLHIKYVVPSIKKIQENHKLYKKSIFFHNFTKCKQPIFANTVCSSIYQENSRKPHRPHKNSIFFHNSTKWKKKTHLKLLAKDQKSI